MYSYLKDKNCILLYMDNFFSTFANSIYGVFTPVILYKSGVSISMILLIYAVQFLIMGIFTPLSGLISKKFGVAVAKGLSYTLKTVSLFLVLNIDTNLIQYFLISMTYGISGSIHNPLNTYLPSKIVNEKFRGRFNSFRYILRGIASIVGYIFVTVFLVKDNNTIIILTVTLFYLFATVSLVGLDKKYISYEFENAFRDSYNYLYNKKENYRLKVVSGLRSFIIIERLIAIPIYLYISLNDLKTFTTIYVISTIVEILSLFITGKNIDKNSKKTFCIVSYIKGVISFIFVIFKSKYILMINQSLYKLIDNVYDTAYSAVSQDKIETDKADTFILSMVHEMCLCFYEFCVLFVLTIIGTFNSMINFKIVFLCSIIVIFINNRIIMSWKEI